jgi:hypothetical protein|tara:strand:- start:495 stop:917 length:423 start_codon:yes stop_codon:yes gene_type:complete
MKQITRITLASFFLIMVSCEDNNTNEEVLAEFGSISGTVNFSGSWPDSGEVLITLDTSYPPQGPPAAFSYITSDDISNGVYNYNFSDLSFRSYEAITVTYWSLGYATAGTNYSLIGSYIEAIDVSQDTPDITIDMDATFD